MKQLLQFTDNKTYFGVNIYRYGVKVDDLKKLPFFDLFADYHGNKLYLTNTEEDYIPLIDWVLTPIHSDTPPISTRTVCP
jgi:hypothetical protein